MKSKIQNPRYTSSEFPNGTVVCRRHCSDVLAGNPLGDPVERDLFVYLPPGYDESRRYPTVYVLSGFTGRGKMMLNDNAFAPDFSERMDMLIGSGRIRPMIAVLPDCFTRYGGSQYLNSTATGRYEDYLTEEIVPFVDSNFATVDDRGARAVIGKSSGGYGALILAMRHADQFALACSIAGDVYFEACYRPDLVKAFRAVDGDPEGLVARMWDEEAKKGKHDFDGLNAIGMSACYSPNGTGYDLPFDLETGRIRPDVWERWLGHDPVTLVENHAENLRSMKLLLIEAGRSDEFAMDIGARVLSSRLREFGIEHIHEEFDGGHFNISHRYNRVLERVSDAF
jgi:enterochelin esterase family protein